MVQKKQEIFRRVQKGKSRTTEVNAAGQTAQGNFGETRIRWEEEGSRTEVKPRTRNCFEATDVFVSFH